MSRASLNAVSINTLTCKKVRFFDFSNLSDTFGLSKLFIKGNERSDRHHSLSISIGKLIISVFLWFNGKSNS